MYSNLHFSRCLNMTVGHRILNLTQGVCRFSAFGKPTSLWGNSELVVVLMISKQCKVKRREMSQRRPVVGRVESVVGGSSRLSNARRGPADTSRHRHWRDKRQGTGRDDFRFYPSRSGPHVVISSPSGHIFIKIVSPKFAGRYHCSSDFEIQRSVEFWLLPRLVLLLY